jgi:hypothetical protein
VRKSREDARSLFSMTYFIVFFESVYEYFLNIVEKSFDFIKVFRVYNFVVVDLEEYVLNFLKYIKSAGELIEFTIFIIGSSFILDNYPSNSYRKRGPF